MIFSAGEFRTGCYQGIVDVAINLTIQLIIYFSNWEIPVISSSQGFLIGLWYGKTSQKLQASWWYNIGKNPWTKCWLVIPSSGKNIKRMKRCQRLGSILKWFIRMSITGINNPRKLISMTVQWEGELLRDGRFLYYGLQKQIQLVEKKWG